MKIVDESILFFSRVSLSIFSLEALRFRGYKGYLYWGEIGMRRVRFFNTELADNLVSRLD